MLIHCRYTLMWKKNEKKNEGKTNLISFIAFHQLHMFYRKEADSYKFTGWGDLRQ